MATKEVTQIELCALVRQCLRECKDSHLNDVTMDNDNESGEIIVTWDDGETKRDFLIKPVEVDRVYDEDDNNEIFIKLRFCPQEWQNDVAIPVAGKAEWFVPLSLIDFDFDEEHELRDELRLHPNAPAWVRDWDGPFEVELANYANWSEFNKQHLTKNGVVKSP